MSKNDIKVLILQKSSIYIKQRKTILIKLKGSERVERNKLYIKNKVICDINQIVGIQIEI